MDTQIRIRRGTKAILESVNPILHPGEEVIEVLAENPDESVVFPRHPITDEAIVNIKVGDGKTPWNDLPYSSGPPGPSAGSGGADIPDATTVIKGKVRYATDAEAVVMSNGLIALTPKNLASIRATETTAGLVRLAAAADIASTDKAATPAGVQKAIENISLPQASPTVSGVTRLATGTDTTSADRAATPQNVTNQINRASQGGIAVWNSANDYIGGPRFVWGSDAKLYQWLAASGPNSQVGPQDPTTPPVFTPPSGLDFGGWTTRSLPSANTWIGIAINDLGRALCVPSSSAATACSTNSGATWTAGGTLPTLGTGAWTGCALNKNNQAVVVKYASASPLIGGAYSVNGGQTWTAFASGLITSSTSNFRGVSMNESGAAICVSHGQAVAFQSVNGGKDWNTANIALPSVANWYDTAINNNGQAVTVANGSNKAAYSVNAGATWTAATLPMSGGATTVDINDRGHAIAIGYQSTAAAYSADGGKTWTAAIMPSASIWEVRINNEDVGVAVGHSPLAVATSVDGGKTWRSADLAPSPSYAAFLDLNNFGEVVTCYTSVTTSYSGAFILGSTGHTDWSPYWEAYDAATPGQNVTASGQGVPRNCILYDGCLYDRGLYPKLWAFVRDFCNPVPDAAWTSEKYSTGDGVTNFRVPHFFRNDLILTNYLKAR